LTGSAGFLTGSVDFLTGSTGFLVDSAGFSLGCSGGVLGSFLVDWDRTFALDIIFLYWTSVEDAKDPSFREGAKKFVSSKPTDSGSTLFFFSLFVPWVPFLARGRSFFPPLAYSVHPLLHPPPPSCMIQILRHQQVLLFSFFSFFSFSSVFLSPGLFVLLSDSSAALLCWSFSCILSRLAASYLSVLS